MKRALACVLLACAKQPPPPRTIDCATIIPPELQRRFFRGPLKQTADGTMTSCADERSAVRFECGPTPMSDQRAEEVIAAIAELLHAERVDFERGAVRGDRSFMFLDRDMPSCKVSIDLAEPNVEIDQLAKQIAARLKP